MARKPGKRAQRKKQPHEEDLLFDPGTALEELHTAVVRIEALSQAAISSLEVLPRVEDAGGRRSLEHTCGLMRVLDEEIAKAVEMGDEMVMRLGEHLKKQRR
jgi:hypothetical protein